MWRGVGLTPWREGARRDQVLELDPVPSRGEGGPSPHIRLLIIIPLVSPEGRT